MPFIPPALMKKMCEWGRTIRSGDIVLRIGDGQVVGFHFTENGRIKDGLLVNDEWVEEQKANRNQKPAPTQ